MSVIRPASAGTYGARISSSSGASGVAAGRACGALAKLENVYTNLKKVFEIARKENITTHEAAGRLAEQRIAAGTCGLRPLQGVGRSKVHAPATLHGTVDRITCKPAIAGEIEPSLALQIEAVAGIGIEAA